METWLVALQGLTRSTSFNKKNPLQISDLEELPGVRPFREMDP
jgi:hypothetical protein